MELITEFPLFRQLPPEIRIKIWKLVPQPARVVGLLPPVSTWYRQYQQMDIPTAPATDGCPFQYRYIVQPEKEAIFAPLHVNREAREIWLPQYFQPPRREQISGVNIQFDMPFISYATDIFTVFDGWPLDGLENGIAAGNNVVDGFIGLERERIRHIAAYEYPKTVERMAKAIAINTLPNLEVFTILSMGPCTFSARRPTLYRDGVLDICLDGQEMMVCDAQRVSCLIHDLSEEVVRNHSLFNHARLFHPGATLYPLRGHQAHVRAWLWHELQDRHQNRAAGQIEALWWCWLSYMLDNDDMVEPKTCPLILDGCGEGGHTKQEMQEWEFPFHMDYKILYAEVFHDILMRSEIMF
ncbi:hypothetical protein ACQKWADRAFT_319481 [Trichoderma austrokoningii]